ncbi:MAG: retroviral-like aspartic protease family protein [Candidatus Chisholmbacteria bacterium]|nr:retroviral-like aspartic protease family protein [Candidatus Chisholmbacteria bacterium]
MKVKNPSRPRKVFEGKFLVDSGATYTVVPAAELKRMGIKPVREEDFVLADGKIISRQVGNALYEYGGVEAAAPVLFGEKGDSLLLGIFTLESLGFSLDPLKRELYKATLRV